jgi:hypothetical protein
MQLKKRRVRESNRTKKNSEVEGKKEGKNVKGKIIITIITVINIIIRFIIFKRLRNRPSILSQYRINFGNCESS